ncbi:MAG TPA: ABC transporter permease [Gemmatimonadales bacterium]|jgi:phospholipid/cholesterol/gamma-HCH transport system permease protein|nr:ABC transporter permease [Gemmatimonadales bacterium]
MTARALDPRRLAGKVILDSLTHLGRVTTLVGELVRALGEWRVWVPRAMAEAYNVGIGSLFIVIVVSAFTGAVTAFQAGYQFQSSLPIYIVGTLIVESVILELGPVLTGLILAGRIGARWAAELGTMRVTEQIDALESLGRSPISHLILPRVVAGMIMIPVLTVISDVVGIVAGLLAGRNALPLLTTADFMLGARYYYRPFDGWYSIIKAFTFAAAITVIPCYVGFNTQQGAEGVGKSTTRAVVATSVVILFLDAVLAKLLLSP